MITSAPSTLHLLGVDPANVTEGATGTVETISVPNLLAGLGGGGTLTEYIAPAVVALTDAATIAVNCVLGNDFYVTLGGNRTLGAPSNPVDRQIIRIDVIQPSSGGPYTLSSYNAVYDFGSGSAPVLSTGAGQIDTLSFRYIASITKWTYLGSGLGY